MLWCGPRRPSPSDVLYLATTKCSGYGDSVSTFSIIAEYRTKVMREGKDVWIFMFSHFRLGSVPKGNVWFFFFFYFFFIYRRICGGFPKAYYWRRWVFDLGLRRAAKYKEKIVIWGQGRRASCGDKWRIEERRGRASLVPICVRFGF